MSRGRYARTIMRAKGLNAPLTYATFYERHKYDDVSLWDNKNIILYNNITTLYKLHAYKINILNNILRAYSSGIIARIINCIAQIGP